MDLDERCQPIELVFSDVDGVLTDGRVVLDSRGIETKRFHIRDGMGIALWQKAGYRFAMVTRRRFVRSSTSWGLASSRRATSATTCPTCPSFAPRDSASPWPTRPRSFVRWPST